LRAEPSTSFLPVVMITASGEQEKVAATEAGADDFIQKPFDQAELLAHVRIKHPALRRRSGAAALGHQDRLAAAVRRGRCHAERVLHAEADSGPELPLRAL